jgi:hypothetical protein
MAKNKCAWEVEFDRETALYDGEFGFNCILINAKKFFKKIANFDGYPNSGYLEILNYYTIRITLPPHMPDFTLSNARDKTLLLLLTNSSPSPTTCKYNNKKDQLTVEWHW